LHEYVHADGILRSILEGLRDACPGCRSSLKVVDGLAVEMPGIERG